jgi:hypothetical protein
MVTLLVDPKQAEILQLAMQNGFISLSMRNPLDSAHEARRLTRAREIAPHRGSIGVTSAADTSKAEAAAAEAAGEAPIDPKLWETLIIRGINSEKLTFPMPEGHEVQGSEPAAQQQQGAPAAEKTARAAPAPRAAAAVEAGAGEN